MFKENQTTHRFVLFIYVFHNSSKQLSIFRLICYLHLSKVVFSLYMLQSKQVVYCKLHKMKSNVVFNTTTVHWRIDLDD